MFTLRCTRTLLKRLKAQPNASPLAPTTRLGDWYANLLYTRPQQLIICVSERTLLPVVIPSRGSAPVAARLAAELAEVLRAIGVSRTSIETELAAMAESSLSTTASRQILGSMNDFASMLETHLAHGDSLIEASLRLAKAPCSPIQMRSPNEVVRELLGQG